MRLASGTKTKIDATEIRTQIASAVSRIARPGVCQQSQVWIPRNRVETRYQTGITFQAREQNGLASSIAIRVRAATRQGSRMQIQKTRAYQSKNDEEGRHVNKCIRGSY